MSNVLVVFGATGQQGGSVITTVLNDPELSKQYRIRGITRNTSSPTAEALSSKGVELVTADADSTPSLELALKGAHTIFALTATVYDSQIKARELAQGKAIADACVAAGASYIIWSSLPSPAKLSSGKISGVQSFEAKAEVEDHIRTLPIKSAFFQPGSFMQNFASNMTPRPLGDGTYALTNFCEPTAQLPLIETAADTGNYVSAILAEPDKFEGKTLWAASEVSTYQEIVEAMSKASGKTVRYDQVPEEVFRGFLPEAMAGNLVDMFKYIGEYGYYGEETVEKVEWTRGVARGKLTGLMEYFEKHPLNLL